MTTSRRVWSSLSLLIVGVAIVGCATTLPTGRMSYASEMSRADAPSVRGFMLAVDRPSCEAAIADVQAEQVSKKQPIKIDFPGGCRPAVLEPGSTYWAADATSASGHHHVIFGTIVQRFCEVTVKNQGRPFARCAQTGLRFTGQ